MTQIYTKMTKPTLTTQMRKLVQKDRNLRIAIAQEIAMAVITIYQGNYLHCPTEAFFV